MVEEGIDDNRIVLDAQDSLTQVESGLLSARVDLYLANINLRYAMGQDLTDMGSK
jgi:outer membrane protein TolC